MNLFKDAAQYYKYRPVYSVELIKLIVSKVKANKEANLLDIGCGTGSLCLPLSKYFKNVFAVDVGEKMIEEGKRLAVLRGVSNISWQNKDGNSLENDFENIQMVTCGCSLHWFNSLKMLEFVHKLLSDNGAVAIVGIWTIWIYAPALWQQKVLEVIKKYLGPKRLTLNGVRKQSGTKNDFVDFLEETGFKGIEKIEFDLPERILSVDEIIGQQYSMS